MYKSERSILALLQILVSSYFIFFVTPLLFNTKSPEFNITNSFNNIYLVYLSYIILIGLFIINCWFFAPWVKHFFKTRTKTHLYNTLILLLLPIALYFYAYYLSDNINLWGDELYQMEDSFKYPLQGSRHQHQMPLSYFFSKVSSVIFGNTDFSLRISSMVLHSLALTSLFFLVKFLSKSYALGFIFIGLCLSNYHILNYSFEARPQSTSLFFLPMLLYAHILFIKSKIIKLKNVIFLFTSTCLFLLSIGFQPPFIVLLLSISSLLVFYKKFNFKKTTYYLLPQFIAGIIFLYFQFFTMKISPPRLYDFTLKNILINDFINFKLFNFTNLDIFKYNYNSFSPNNLIFFLFTLTVLSLFLSKRYKFKSHFNLKLASSYLLTILFFCFLVYNFYEHHIKWPFGYKYFHLALPITYLYLTLLLQTYLRGFSQKTRNVLSYELALSIIIFLSLFLRTSNKKEVVKRWNHFATQTSYKYLKKNLNDNSPVYCFYIKANISDCHAFGHYNRFINHYTPQKKINNSMFKFGVQGQTYTFSEHKKYAIIFEGDKKNLSQIITKINFNKNAIVSIKPVRFGLIIIFKVKLRAKEEIFKNLLLVRNYLNKSYPSSNKPITDYINSIK